jgi:hypothetical protein
MDAGIWVASQDEAEHIEAVTCARSIFREDLRLK